MVCGKKKLVPEERVRQLYLNCLVNKYKYSKELIDVETIVNFGREKSELI